jgi:hypothetical protein
VRDLAVLLLHLLSSSVDETWARMPDWAGLTHGNHRFVQASLRHDRRFATDTLFRLSEAAAAGVHPECVHRLTRQGQLTRVGRGLFALSTLEPTEHHTPAEVATASPRVFSACSRRFGFMASGRKIRARSGWP